MRFINIHETLREREHKGSGRLQYHGQNVPQENFQENIIRISSDDYAENGGLGRPGDECVPLYSLQFAKESKSSHLLILGDERGHISIINTKVNSLDNILYKPNKLRSWTAHTGSILDIQWCQSDSKALTSSSDHYAALWDLETASCLATFGEHDGTVRSAAHHPADLHVFTTASRDGSIRIWDTRCSTLEPAMSTGPQDSNINQRPVDIISKAHSPGIVESINFKASRTKKSLGEPPLKKQKSEPTYSVASAKFLPHHSAYLAMISAGAVDGTLKIWDCRSLSFHMNRKSSSPVEHVTPSINHNNRPYGISCLEISNSGCLVYATCLDNSLNSDITRLQSSSFQTSNFTKTSISSDDRFLISGSTQGSVQLWDTAKPGNPSLSFTGHDADVSCVSWASNSIQCFASCSDDNTIRLWHPEAYLSTGPISWASDNIPVNLEVGHFDPKS